MSFTAVPHPEDAPPRTVAAWLERIVAGADPAPLAHQAHRAAAEEQSTAVWLHVCSGAAWQAQMSVLGARLSSNADRRALPQRYPLLGVPFAAKDNIDIAGAPTTAACPVSIFAHSVADAAHVLSVIEGPDAADAYSAYRPGSARWPGRPRIGVAKAPRFNGDAGYAPAYAAALARAAKDNPIVELDFTPLNEVAALLYQGPWVAERHAAVRPLMESRPEALEPAWASTPTSSTCSAVVRWPYPPAAPRSAYPSA